MPNTNKKAAAKKTNTPKAKAPKTAKSATPTPGKEPVQESAPAETPAKACGGRLPTSL